MPSSPDQGLAKLVRYLQDVSNRPGPHDLRASDADRDLVITMLSEAAGDGRLSLSEHAERSEQALSARTLGELVRLTSDLSLPSGQPIRLYPRRSVTALFARERRQGRWVVPDSFPVTAFFGDVVLDLRDAILQSHRVTIHVTAVAAQVRLIVPEGIAVEMPGRAVLGVRSVRGVKPARGRTKAPEPVEPKGVIEVRTLTIGGSVKAVVVRPPRRQGLRRRPPA
jgi:hypothetical protein